MTQHICVRYVMLYYYSRLRNKFKLWWTGRGNLPVLTIQVYKQQCEISEEMDAFANFTWPNITDGEMENKIQIKDLIDVEWDASKEGNEL